MIKSEYTFISFNAQSNLCVKTDNANGMTILDTTQLNAMTQQTLKSNNSNSNTIINWQSINVSQSHGLFNIDLCIHLYPYFKGFLIFEC